jgi:hypothetical protein
MKTHTHHKIDIFVAFLLTALAVLFLTATTAAAQVDERDHGLYAGLRFVGSSLHVDDDAGSAFFVKDDGGGAMLYIGYSFNPVFSLEVDGGGMNHDTSDPRIDARFGAFQILAHYRFSPGRAFRPYIKGGVGGYALVLDDNTNDVRIEGGGFPIGGGFDYFFSRHFSLGADFTHNIIQYEKVTVDLGGATVGFDIDEEGAMTSLGLSLTYYF